ncbi:MAG: helix-turn-helix domain-containing protein [Pirellulales bacterium]
MVLAAPRRRRADRRRTILEAALACFARVGFAATTMADIRREARASIGSIYHHYNGKEQLAAALFVEGLRDYQQSLLAEMKRVQSGRGVARRSVAAIVGHYLRWVAAHPDWARYLLEMGQSPFVAEMRDEVERMNRQFFGELKERLQAHVDAGELARLPLSLQLAILVGPARDFARQWLRGAEVDIKQAGRVLAEAAWKSLRTKTRKG